MCSKPVTLDQVTIIASMAGQQLNTDTWDDELNADSGLNADSANSSIRTTTPNDNALGRHCANQAPLRHPNAGKNTDQDFATSAMLVKSAVTFAAGIDFSIVLTAL